VNDSPSVLIAIADMGSGGAQQVASNLANHWVRSGVRVGVVTWSDATTEFFELDTAIKRFLLPDLGVARNVVMGFANNVRRVVGLRRAMRQFDGDVIVSFIAPTNVLAILAASGLGHRVVISERNDPARQSFGRVWDFLRKLLYGRADLVTANSRAAIETLKAYVPPDRLAYVPNPIREPAKGRQDDRSDETLFLSVGRLHNQKAYDVLIEAFADISGSLPDWRLAIVGKGGEWQRLTGQIKSLGMTSRIDLVGEVSDPFEWYERAGVFVMASRYEGSPNALLEAMSCGCPAIVSDAVPDHAELSKGGKAARVVPVDDVAALADAMTELAGDLAQRERLGNAATKHVHAQRIESVAPLWSKAVWGEGAIIEGGA
jgi:glycosyltransferase involved in cell wall biosynthesis